MSNRSLLYMGQVTEVRHACWPYRFQKPVRTCKPVKTFKPVETCKIACKPVIYLATGFR